MSLRGALATWQSLIQYAIKNSVDLQAGYGIGVRQG